MMTNNERAIFLREKHKMLCEDIKLIGKQIRELKKQKEDLHNKAIKLWAEMKETEKKEY